MNVGHTGVGQSPHLGVKKKGMQTDVKTGEREVAVAENEKKGKKQVLVKKDGVTSRELGTKKEKSLRSDNKQREEKKL